MGKLVSLIIVILILAACAAQVETVEDMGDRNKETVEVNEWMARGYEAYKNKDYDKAIEYYKKAIVLNPNLAKAHYNLGTNYSNKGMLDEAISEFEQVLTIDPDYAEAHNNLGNVYSEKGMVDESLSEYEKAITINPDLPQAHYNIGFSYLQKGLNSLAADHLLKAGLLYLEKGDKESALVTYEVLKRTDSEEQEKTLFEKLYPGGEQGEKDPQK